MLDKEHVESLSSGHWKSAKSKADKVKSSSEKEEANAKPTCDNHDDGETLAIIKCEQCGNLCGDCERFLHLSRQAKRHQRQVFKEEEDAIKVDLHEGCGRAKLFWVMALADSLTLKAMVEFRDGSHHQRGSIDAVSGISKIR